MNRKKERLLRELCIAGGFILEVLSFIGVGLAFMMGWIFWAIWNFLIGMGWAWLVGSLMRTNSIENYKWGLE